MLSDRALVDNDYPRAIHHMKQALDVLDADDSEARVNVLDRLGNLYMAANMWTDALDTLALVSQGLVKHGKLPTDDAIIEVRGGGRERDNSVWSICIFEKRMVYVLYNHPMSLSAHILTTRTLVVVVVVDFSQDEQGVPHAAALS